jgi:DNA-binding NarL/FixJ family response regulator
VSERKEAPIRVVLVDDQSLVRAGFALVIDSQPDLEVVGQAGDGEAAVDLITQVQPDVVLMDVRMPRLDGIRATSQILALADEGTIRAPRIIVLTTFDEDEYALAALRSGASGFLLKDVLPEVLLDSIRTVVDGGAVIAPTTTRRLLDSQLLNPTVQSGTTEAASRTKGAPSEGAGGAGERVTPASAPPSNPASPAAPTHTPDPQHARLLATLTPREQEVLELMGRGLSNAEIVEALVLAEATVKTHVGRILMKLGVRDRVQAVIFAYDAGIVTPGS